LPLAYTAALRPFPSSQIKCELAMELFHICSIAEIVILGQTMHKIIIYLHIHASTAISTRVEVEMGKSLAGEMALSCKTLAQTISDKHGKANKCVFYMFAEWKRRRPKMHNCQISVESILRSVFLPAGDMLNVL